MRLLSGRCGFTLIELLITIAIAALMATFAGPMLTDYLINSRLREAGNALMAEALYAQGEAVKRNGVVRLAINSASLRTLDMSAEGLAANPAGNLLRERPLPSGVTADTAVDVTFDSEGRTTPFGTDYTVNTSNSGTTCSSEYRCPVLRVDAGGAIRLCGDRTQPCE